MLSSSGRGASKRGTQQAAQMTSGSDYGTSSAVGLGLDLDFLGKRDLATDSLGGGGTMMMMPGGDKPNNPD